MSQSDPTWTELFEAYRDLESKVFRFKWAVRLGYALILAFIYFVFGLLTWQVMEVAIPFYF